VLVLKGSHFIESSDQRVRVVTSCLGWKNRERYVCWSSAFFYLFLSRLSLKSCFDTKYEISTDFKNIPEVFCIISISLKQFLLKGFTLQRVAREPCNLGNLDKLGLTVCLSL